MFGKKKEPRQPRPVGSLEQYGIFEVPDINIDNINNNMEDDDDESLEVELAALAAGNDTSYKSRRNATRKSAADVNLDEMVTDCLKDTNSDEESIEGDDDPALLRELQMLTGNEIVAEKADIPELVKEETESDEHETKEEDNSISNKLIELLQERLKIYEIAEQKAKRNDETSRARRYNRGIKTLKEMLVSVQSGESVNEADIPAALPSSATTESTVQNIEEKTSLPVKVSETIVTSDTSNNDNPPAVEDVTVDQEALDKLKKQQQKYKTAAVAWKRAGNKEQALQYVKIVKQFDIVIAAVAEGEKLDLSDMPPTPILPSPTSIITTPAAKEENELQQQGASGQKSNQRITSRAEKQMLQLQLRQRELKQAALNAKKDGDMDLARDYLRQAKGIQPLIEASKAGLPVDMTSIPLSPLEKVELSTAQKDENFILISKDFSEDLNGTDDTIYENLDTQLMKQIKWCLSTRDHSKALGDVPGYNRWERLALSYTRDLDMLRVRKRDSLPPPQHHYETKTYQIVQSCTDLNDNDIEISIIRGINYSREADTYVMYEFPFPLDNHPIDRTLTIKDSANPEYQATFLLNGIINRTSRQCQRAFKRHALKCEIWTKGGFFRSDSLLGTVMVKLQPLESQCTLHDSFPLMDGRKATGGKLELKIRLRNPILFKQIENITDKWLTIDQ
ncbi:PREDICTED: coiled-coil and C2 domain-containing protein 1-like isoform X2 [Atta colombica]|uniref:coiled-coil and C2 domain-containing protein 1-like isoform X2 n=1 Tax=Atta colombica TaxID=520822 RepID=UPI00084C5577|nr:PREDICTED: coiled-coil and C2 domain-containing protein 1-like isoform X2 [Atta colombica]